MEIDVRMIESCRKIIRKENNWEIKKNESPIYKKASYQKRWNPSKKYLTN